MKRKEWVSNETFVQNIRIQLPVLIAEGDRPGQTVFICAAQHGREIHGVAAILQRSSRNKKSSGKKRFSLFLHVAKSPVRNIIKIDERME